jgi:TATA-box binding protein (TBP) (component of TFIID and TFIIIB)
MSRGSSSSTPKVSVGTVYAEEQVQETTNRVAEYLDCPRTTRRAPLTVDNIVCTYTLGLPAHVEVNLAALATAINGRLGEWKPKTQSDKGVYISHMQGVVGTDQPFQSCVSRCRETGTTNSIFASSQIVIGGAKSVEIALVAVHLLSTLIRKKVYYRTRVLNFQVQNAVASFGMGFPLNLEAFLHFNFIDCTWSPMDFKGLKWSFEGVTFVLFRSGNAVLTGGKSFDELNRAYNKAIPELLKYRLGHEHESVRVDASLLRTTPPKQVKDKTLSRRDKLQQTAHKRIEAKHIEDERQYNQAERLKRKREQQDAVVSSDILASLSWPAPRPLPAGTVISGNEASQATKK